MVFAALLLIVIYTDSFVSKQPDMSLGPVQTFHTSKYFAGTGNGDTVGMFATVLREGHEVGVQIVAPDGSIVLRTMIDSEPASYWHFCSQTGWKLYADYQEQQSAERQVCSSFWPCSNV